MKKISILAAILVFVVWFFFTFLLKYVLGTHENDVELSELVTGKLNYGIFLAAITMLLFSFLHKSQNRVGLTGSGTYFHKIMIFPVLLIILSLFASFSAGALSDFNIIKWVLINTLFVGISEELMFRGILMSSFTAKWGYWPAVIWVTALFGLVHVLNGFTTGDFGMAAVQALLAASSGLLFLAIRVKTLSIIPAILIHWFWDFTVFMSGMADNSEMDTFRLLVSVVLILGPVIYGIIGIISLRNKKAAEAYVASQN